MKKFKKSTAIILSVILGVLLVVGCVFSFVPMTFGAKRFVSLSGSLNVSSDLSGGMYGEYEIKTENPSKSDIIESMAIIKDVFEENGYKNTNVYAVGNSKIRAEVSYPNGDETYASVYSQLSEVAAGAFSLRSTYSLEDTSIVLEGSKYVDEVKIFTNNDSKNMSIIFNKEGQEKYKQLCSNASSFYLVLGEYSQQISASGVTDFTQLSLSNTDWDNLIALEQKVKLGCMKIELDSSTAVINTMSASLSAGESASTPVHKDFSTSTAYVVVFSSFFIVLVLGLAVFAIRFGLYAILMLVTLLFNTVLFIGIICLIPSVEFGLSAIASLVIGVSVIYTYAFSFVSKVKSEYNVGKSLNASLESAYKKQMPSFLMSNVMLFLASLIMFAFSFGELSSVSVIFTVCVFLSMLTNLFIVPLLIKICISFNGFGHKLFMLKKRSGISENVDEEDFAKEVE